LLAGRKVTVVIPAYRAAATIADVIAAMPEFVDAIVVVDDASPDDTSRICSSLNESRLVLVRHERNQGVGGAMATGFRAALERGPDIVVKMDADGQMGPSYLQALLAPLVHGRFDYAKANRFYDCEELARMPLPRRWGNVALSFLNKVASGYWNVYDPQNGYVAVTAETLSRLDLDSLDRGYFFENSMLIQLNVISARVAEVPIPARYAGEGSSMDLKRILVQFPWKLFRGWLMRVRLKYFGMDFSPVAVLLVIGGLLLVGGVGYGAYEWTKNAIRGVATPAGTVMVAALPTLLGAQLLLTALLLEISQTPPGLGIRRILGRPRQRHRRGASRSEGNGPG
jgi:glycosyltransferase involved in cell wall biosynthesis